jgi:glucosamine--fructose-6-phosphate aminotransferase (isomerizing)
MHHKVLSNIQEIRARGAMIVAIADEDDETVNEYADVLVRLPKLPTLLQPLLAVVYLQVLACELASQKGHDVDQPRDLAKSVTSSRARPRNGLPHPAGLEFPGGCLLHG